MRGGGRGAGPGHAQDRCAAGEGALLRGFPARLRWRAPRATQTPGAWRTRSRGTRGRRSGLAGRRPVSGPQGGGRASSPPSESPRSRRAPPSARAGRQRWGP